MRLFLLLSFFALLVPATVAAMTTDNQKLLKVDLMVVTAHPDDEGMCAATMARLSLDGGKTVALVTATRGETGGNSTGKEYGHALGVVREAELRRCLAVLGVQYLEFLDVPDFAYTESATATLERWGHDETLRRLVRLVRLMRPDVIVTMDPAPTGGQHGNHQVAGRLATEAY
ncbi:MAG: PIG-L family deacetylase, partial [Dehalococcoidia bacterium]